MKNSLLRIILRGGLSLVLTVAASADNNPPIQVVSTANPALPRAAGGNSDSLASVISADGRFVAFLSSASNLVTNDNNGIVVDVFLRNRTNDTTTLISVSLDGTGGGNGNSISPGVSADGRYVVFESVASNLVANDTNNASDIFLRDVQSGTTTLVSVAPSGAGGGNGASSDPTITPDGRYLVFVSAASDLVPNDTNGVSDVFARDLQTGTTTLVSVSANGGTSGNGSSDSPAITPDGRWVAFASKATNLVAGVSNNQGEIYARDLVSNTTVWVGANVGSIMFGVNSQSHPINSYNPAISDDGNYVAFKSIGAASLILRHNLQTGMTDLISTNTLGNSIGFDDPSGPDMTPDGRFIAYTTATALNNTYSAVHLWDAQTGTRTLVSANLGGTISSNTFSDTPAVSADGRFVAFVSDASDFATNAIDGSYQVYVRDVLNDTTKLVSADVNGGVSGETGGAIPTITADGRFVAFDGLDGGYVAEDNNNAYDVFVRDTASDTTELISLANTTTLSVTANNLSSVSANSISSDNRFVTFASSANDIATNDNNDYQDVFVRDLQTGTNILVSINKGGTGTANGFSGSQIISGNGRNVAFVSSADDLTDGDTNRIDDIFVRDLQTGVTQLVSVSTNGTGGNAASSAPVISTDGRYVAFLSLAGNLVPNDFNTSIDVFWRDLQAGTTVNASSSGRATSLSMSADGRYVAYIAATPLRLFVWDAQSNAFAYSNSTANISTAVITADGHTVVFQAGSQLLAHNMASNTDLVIGPVGTSARPVPQVSSNGRFVVFVSGATNMVPNDTNGASDVLLYDLQTGTTTLVSVNSGGTGPGNGASDSPSISADGRFIAYRSFASDIVDNDNNGQPDVFSFDRLTGRNTLLSVNQAGSMPADNRSGTPVVSSDGNIVVFRSVASDLVAGDLNNNQDVFYSTLQFTTFVDSDADGMDDNWERTFFSDLSHNGLTDSDGDGLSDLAEYKAGTNPMNAASAFVCWVVNTSLGNGTTIGWPASPARAYKVQYKDDLGDPVWHDLPSGVTIVGVMASCLDTNGTTANQRFYRVTLTE